MNELVTRLAPVVRCPGATLVPAEIPLVGGPADLGCNPFLTEQRPFQGRLAMRAGIVLVNRDLFRFAGPFDGPADLPLRRTQVVLKVLSRSPAGVRVVLEPIEREEVI